MRRTALPKMLRTALTELRSIVVTAVDELRSGERRPAAVLDGARVQINAARMCSAFRRY
jgi:hypothetical protein